MQPCDVKSQPQLRTVLVTAAEALALLAAGYTAIALLFCV
jgi:hypothetical protein